MAHQDTSRRADPRDVSPDTGRTRRVPPLIWIILALLVAWFAIAMWQRQEMRPTAAGPGTVTSTQQTQGAAPNAPPTSNAPAPY